MGCNNIMQIEKTIKIDISDKDIEIVRLIAEGETKNKITAENTMICMNEFL